jgi:3-oxoacyl-[acyl-carrier-protein] synthase II
MPATLRRVVITGLGALTPYGAGKEVFWEGLTARPPAIRRVTAFDTTGLAVQIAAEVPDFEPDQFMDRKVARRSGRFIQMGVAAARMALQDAGLEPSLDDEIGVYVGTSAAFFTFADEIARSQARGWERLDPFYLTRESAHMGAARIGLALGLRGPNTTVNSACASGLDAIGQAVSALRLGHAAMMLAGGSEATTQPYALALMAFIGALTKSFNDNPTRASRPFDRCRDGFVIAEGAGMLLLETLEHAVARDAHIYAEVLGTGWSFDANNDTAPSSAGEVLAMRRALRDAGIDEREVDAVKAHATSTVLGDPTETAAIKMVLGERAHRVPVVAPKSKIGHALAASGGVEAVASALMVERQTLVPTANLEHPDPACDLDYVAEGPRPATIDTLLQNAFGLGGQNACMVLRRWRE